MPSSPRSPTKPHGSENPSPFRKSKIQNITQILLHFRNLIEFISKGIKLEK